MDRELIFLAAEEAELTRTYACCGVADKLCNTDEWRGNLEAFAAALLRLAGKEENP